MGVVAAGAVAMAGAAVRVIAVAEMPAAAIPIPAAATVRAIRRRCARERNVFMGCPFEVPTDCRGPGSATSMTPLECGENYLPGSQQVDLGRPENDTARYGPCAVPALEPPSAGGLDPGLEAAAGTQFGHQPGDPAP